MKGWLKWGLIGLAVVAVIVIIYIYIMRSQRKTVEAQVTLQEQKNLEQKLKNAPESRADILEQMRAVEQLRLPFLTAYTASQTKEKKREGAAYIKVKAAPPTGMSVGFKSGDEWAYTTTELKAIINYYDNKYKTLENQLEQLY
jgi:uncharacterized membrane protein YhiD involved in acid resistance